MPCADACALDLFVREVETLLIWRNALLCLNFLNSHECTHMHVTMSAESERQLTAAARAPQLLHYFNGIVADHIQRDCLA